MPAARQTSSDKTTEGKLPTSRKPPERPPTDHLIGRIHRPRHRPLGRGPHTGHG
jgi:hypothetical protein